MRRTKWQCFSLLRATGIAPFPILIAADSVFHTDVRYFLYLHRSKEEPGVEEDGEGLAAYQTVTAWYGRKRMFTVRDHNVDSLSPKFPPPPFPMSVWSTGLLEDRHGCCVHYHCGRPWNYRRGAAFPSEKRRGMPETGPGLRWNPVIKILCRMLIQWKKPKWLYSVPHFWVLIKSQDPFSKIHAEPLWVRAGGECGGEADRKVTAV